MNETKRPDVGEHDAILDTIEVTEGVYSLPAVVRNLSPDELEAAGLPRAFLALDPVQKAAAVRAARGALVEPEELGREVPLETVAIAEFGDGDGDGDDADEELYSVSSEAPRSDEELDAELKRYEEADDDEDESSPE